MLSSLIDVCVVGGGASGLFAAVAAARAGASVVILEAGAQPLRKVHLEFIVGGNVLSRECYSMQQCALCPRTHSDGIAPLQRSTCGLSPFHIR